MSKYLVKTDDCYCPTYEEGGKEGDTVLVVEEVSGVNYCLKPCEALGKFFVRSTKDDVLSCECS